MTATLKSLGNGAFFSTARLRQPPLFPRCVRSALRAFRAFPTKTTQNPHTAFPSSGAASSLAGSRRLRPFGFTGERECQRRRSARPACHRLPPPNALRSLNDEGDGTTMPPPVLFKQIADYFSMVSMVRCVLVNTQMSAAMAMDSFTISEGVMDV